MIDNLIKTYQIIKKEYGINLMDKDGNPYCYYFMGSLATSSDLEFLCKFIDPTLCWAKKEYENNLKKRRQEMIKSREEAIVELTKAKEIVKAIGEYYREVDYFSSKKFYDMENQINSVLQSIHYEIKKEKEKEGRGVEENDNSKLQDRQEN